MSDIETREKEEYDHIWINELPEKLDAMKWKLAELLQQHRFKHTIESLTAKNSRGEYVQQYSKQFLNTGNTSALTVELIRLLDKFLTEEAASSIAHQDMRKLEDMIASETMV